MRRSVLIIACCAVFSGCAGPSTTSGNGGSGHVTPEIRQNGHNPAEWESVAIDNAVNGTLADIAAGPLKSLWFTDPADAIVGRVGMNAKVSTFTLSGMAPTMLAVDGGGLIYFDQCTAQLGSVTSAGATKTYAIPSGSTACGQLVKGPGGDVWFGESGHIGKVTRSGQVREFKLHDRGAVVQGVTNGPDGALWFTEQGVNAIERIDPNTHAITSFDLSSVGACNPVGITQSSDGNIWFGCSSGQHIGKMNISGGATLFATPYPVANIKSIGEGPDGNPWFVSAQSGALAEFDPSTGNTDVHVPPNANGAVSFADGTDGNVWIAEGKQVGVFIIELMEVSPTSLSFSFPNQTGYIDVTEPGSPVLTAVSSNNNVASAGVLQQQMTVYVNSHASGTCIVTISDAIGNSYQVPVTVQ